MPKLVDISIPPTEMDQPAVVRAKACRKAGVTDTDVVSLRILRRSIDARREPTFRLRVELRLQGDPPVAQGKLHSEEYLDVSDSPPVVIVGAGPAGLFAALECLRLGLKPIILERGKDVQQRRRDLRNIQQEGVVNPDSNYCFGEGGAGTYSDGKLYTRAKKRGDVRTVLEVLVEHGAKSAITMDAHPHIGSNKLPKIIANIRQRILDHGGEVHFGQRVTDLMIRGGSVMGALTQDGSAHEAGALILATGHSARDIYQLLQDRGVSFEAKPYAMGLRTEHPQSLIDRIQYGQDPRHPNLPAADYRLSCQIGGRGVFSFCMCPGGLIVPAATAPGEIVVNGMSLSRRDSPYANSGMVVSLGPKEWTSLGYQGSMGGLGMQQDVERNLFEAGDQSMRAPAQRLLDFLDGVSSSDLPGTSYIPGLQSSPLHELLPSVLAHPLAAGLRVFGKQMRGYLDENAVLVGVESRTSSPIRIHRDPLTLEHPSVSGLFPSGEGAGYAGGIVSAALDGQRVARAVQTKLNVNT